MAVTKRSNPVNVGPGGTHKPVNTSRSCQEPTVTKSFAAIICFAAMVLLASTGAHGCGNPADALTADPALTQTDTSAQQAAPKDRRPTEQGEKSEQGAR